MTRGTLMEMRHLRYFIAVAEYENIHTASTRLHVTQPAISRQIHDLEEELGFRACSIATLQGLEVDALRHAVSGRGPQRYWRRCTTRSRRGGACTLGFQGRLKISLVESVGWHGYVPEIVGEFQARRATGGDRTRAQPHGHAAAATSSARGSTAAFMYPFDVQPSDELAVVPLTLHNVVLAVPRKLGHGRRRSGCRRATCVTRPFVTFPRHLQPQFHDRLLQPPVRSAGLTLNVVQEAPTDTAILSLVSAGIGAAILNSANFGRPPLLTQFLKIEDVQIDLPFSFVYRSDNANPALARFVEVVEAVRARSATVANP